MDLNVLRFFILSFFFSLKLQLSSLQIKKYFPFCFCFGLFIIILLPPINFDSENQLSYTEEEANHYFKKKKKKHKYFS